MITPPSAPGARPSRSVALVAVAAGGDAIDSAGKSPRVIARVGNAPWDDAHQYGGTNLIIGDPRVYGRAYIAPAGRGILYGEPK